MTDPVRTRTNWSIVKRWGPRVLGVGLIAGLIGLGFVAVRFARNESRRDQCVNNLRQIGLGLSSYQSAFQCCPPGAEPNQRLEPADRMSWQLGLLPQMCCLNCWGLDDWSDIDHSAGWDAGPQRKFAVLPLEPFVCPSAYEPASGTHSIDHYLDRSQLTELVPATYIGIAGLGKDAAWLKARDPKAGVFGYDRITRLEELRDGASSTIAVAETSDLQSPWTSGGPATVRGVDPTRQPYIGQGRQFGGNHQNGVNVLLADGAVWSIRAAITLSACHGFAALSSLGLHSCSQRLTMVAPIGADCVGGPHCALAPAQGAQPQWKQDHRCGVETPGRSDRAGAPFSRIHRDLRRLQRIIEEAR